MSKRKREENSEEEEIDLSFLEPPMKKRKIDFDNKEEVVNLMDEIICGKNKKKVRIEVQKEIKRIRNLDDENKKYVIEISSEMEILFPRLKKKLKKAIKEFKQKKEFIACGREFGDVSRVCKSDCDCHVWEQKRGICSWCEESWFNYQGGVWGIYYATEEICQASRKYKNFGEMSKLVNKIQSKINSIVTNISYEWGEKFTGDDVNNNDIEYDPPNRVRRIMAKTCKMIPKVLKWMIDEIAEDQKATKIREYFEKKLREFQDELDKIDREDFESLNVLFSGVDENEESSDEDEEYEKDYEDEKFSGK